MPHKSSHPTTTGRRVLRHLGHLRLTVYCRVSTNGQAIKGDSIQLQEEACRAWAAEHGHEVVSVFTDNGLSGRLGEQDRPGLAAALLSIRHGTSDGLLVYSLDRLARALHVQEAALQQVWAAEGRVFEAVHGEVQRDDPDDPVRSFTRQILGAVAELEAGMIRSRLRRGRARKASRGEYVGGPRLHRKYGYSLIRVDGRYVYEPVAEEQDIIARVVAERAAGRTFRAIAGDLNAEGIAPPSGREWYPATIRLITEREGA
jgi:DNA invertase Pin-like site-specific DNA recombinase